MDKHFWRALGLFAGGMIGVGLFGLPAALARAGLQVFLVQAVGVAVLVWWIHRSYLVVVRATPGRHRLPGYAYIHLGPAWGVLTTLANLMGLVGTLVAYLIAGGGFLRLLVESHIALPASFSALLYLAPGAVLLLVGIRALPTIELMILALFLVVLFLVPGLAGSAVSLGRVPATGSLSAALLPYGVFLFSYWGISLIPETNEIAGKRGRRAYRVLTAGLITAALAYLFFAVSIVAITGARTTEDALTGLRQTLGDGVVSITLLFGLLTTFSSYLALGLTLLRTLMLDFRWSRHWAWAVTVAIPFALVLLGVRSLLAVLSVTGAVFLGIEGLVILRLWWQVSARKRAGSVVSQAAIGLVSLLLLAGVAAAITRTLVP